MIAPTALIAHAIPRLLEGNGLRPHAPVGDEIVFEGEIHGDPFWVMLTPAPHDATGARRTMDSLAARFKPGKPPTRGIALLVLLHGTGAPADLAALDHATPREGTEPILRAAEIDLADGTMRGDVDAIRPLRAVAKTLAKAVRAALAGEAPPDLRAIVAEQTNLALAYRARRPWATWAMTVAIVALFLAQQWTVVLRGAMFWPQYRTPSSRPDLLFVNTILMPAPSETSGMVVLYLALTVISLLALGAMIERLYGWAAFFAMWFLPAVGAGWWAAKAGWLVLPGPTSPVFALMGATLAMGALRRALPWTFRRSLLVGSAPILLVNILILVFTAREAARETLLAIAGGGLLAAVLPFRAPLTERGGPLVARIAVLLAALACAGQVGRTAWILLRPAEVAKETPHASEEGWTATAPAGYRVETPAAGVTTFSASGVQITIEAREKHEVQEAPEREVARIRDQWSGLRGSRIAADEEVVTSRARWKRLRVEGETEFDLYVGEVGEWSVSIRAVGNRGSTQRAAEDVRSVVESFRPTR